MSYKKITTVAAVFAALSMNPDIKPDVSAWPEHWRAHKIIEFDVQMSIDAINGKNDDGTQWVAKWGDPTQHKWEVWYDVVDKEDGVSGRGLSLVGVYCGAARTTVGPRLVFRSRAHAMHFHEHFLPLNEQYYLDA